MTRTISETELTVDTSELIAGTTYDLIIESFDDYSVKKSTLKTDTIQIILLVSEI